MGVCYYVCCRTCRVMRDLDKFYGMISGDVVSRDRALAYADQEISKHPFQPGLLVSFMWLHKGHSCTVMDESNDEIDDFCLEPIDFWNPDDTSIAAVREYEIELWQEENPGITHDSRGLRHRPLNEQK